MDDATSTLFGRTLRQLRTEANISQRRLARRVPVSQASLSRYETGDQAIDPATAARLDDLLGAGGQLHALAPSHPAPDLLSGNDNGTFIDRDRLAHVARRPRTVDRAALDSLATVLASTRRLEDSIGAAPVLLPMRGHMTFVTSLVKEAHGPIRPEVVGQAGQWAEYLGWLYTAHERYDDAGRWFSRSLEWAIEAQDDDLAATVWSFKGHVAWLQGQIGPTIGLSQVARRYRGIYPGQLAYDALQEARGHAALQDAYRVELLIDESQDLAERALIELPGAPPWHYYRSPAFWDLERGRALHSLPGQAKKAVELLTAGLDALPPEQASADWVTAYRRDLAVASRRQVDRGA